MSDFNLSSSSKFTDYTGQILSGDYSDLLKNTLLQQINASRDYGATGLNIFTYIAAWKLDNKGIWYEFVGQQFLDLFACQDAECLCGIFSNSILDRREYEYEKSHPDISETKLQPKEIDSQRPRLRNETAKSGYMQAVYKVCLPDKRTVWLKDWATVTTFFEDGICLSPGYMTDISMEMKQKDQVSELNVLVNRDKGLLVEAERSAALGQISAKVFHEIRNPVSAIGGLARRLLKKSNNGNSQPFIEIIVKESDRLEEILNNLFSFTQPVEPSFATVDPVDLVKGVLGLLRSDFDKASIKVELNIAKDIGSLSLDWEQMHLALVHIVKNSVESMFDGGKLNIDIYRVEEKVVIAIKDSGSGISSVHESRVKEPFFTTKVYGTGLGLSIAEKAIDMHNGNMTMTRLESGGTESIITLFREN